MTSNEDAVAATMPHRLGRLRMPVDGLCKGMIIMMNGQHPCRVIDILGNNRPGERGRRKVWVTGISLNGGERVTEFFEPETGEVEIDLKPVLVWGGKGGWIGRQMIQRINALDMGVYAVAAESRLEDRNAVAQELDAHRPWRVFNCAGVTGRPNVDYLETHKAEAIRSNVVGLLNLADLTHERGIHLINMATGCIYQYDQDHPLASGKGFTESDPANFTDSWYSLTKGLVEPMLQAYDKVLTLRLRMPISDDLSERSFITKITKYERVVDVPNSMSVLHELLPAAIDLSFRQVCGVVNFVNPGVISHNEILGMYRDIIHPSFEWKNFSLEEQAKILEAGRSNNELDTSKLETLMNSADQLVPWTVRPIQEAVRLCIERMKVNLDLDLDLDLDVAASQAQAE